MCFRLVISLLDMFMVVCVSLISVWFRVMCGVGCVRCRCKVFYWGLVWGWCMLSVLVCYVCSVLAVLLGVLLI